MGRFFKYRLVFAVIVVLLALAVAFSQKEDFYCFFNMNFGSGASSYNTVERDELEVGMPMSGKVYYVIDCLASSYTEYSRNGTVTSTVTDDYYYLIPFEDDELILLITDADSELEEQMDALYWYDEDLMDKGVTISGVVTETEKELYSYFEDWCDEWDISGYSLCAYTIDCTISVEKRCSRFTIALVLYTVLLVSIIFAVVLFIKRLKGRPSYASAPVSYSSGSGYDTYNSGSSRSGYDTYNSGSSRSGYDTYNSGSSRSGYDTYNSGSANTNRSTYGSLSDSGRNAYNRGYNTSSNYDFYKSGSVKSESVKYQSQSQPQQSLQTQQQPYQSEYPYQSQQQPYQSEYPYQSQQQPYQSEYPYQSQHPYQSRQTEDDYQFNDNDRF